DLGDVVGSLDYYSSGLISQGHFYRLPGFGEGGGHGWLSGINNAGAIAGEDNFKGEIYHLGDPLPLSYFNIPGAVATTIEGINNNGNMVVWHNSGTGYLVLDIGGEFSSIAFPGLDGIKNNNITDINDLNQVVGVYNENGVIPYG